MKPNTEKFIADYIATALWSSIDDNGEPLDGLYTADDIAPETLEVMRADCIDFIESIGELANETNHPGQDFWLTRNGHGAGFWDGDYPKHGDQLTEHSKPFGSFELYVGDDGFIHHCG